MILDRGYHEGDGYDSSFSLCFRLDTLARNYYIYWEKSNVTDNEEHLKLDVYLSFSDDTHDRFLEENRAVTIVPHQCNVFSVEGLVRNKFLQTGNFHARQFEYVPKVYNQAFCLDFCIQDEIMNAPSPIIGNSR